MGEVVVCNENSQVCLGLRRRHGKDPGNPIGAMKLEYQPARPAVQAGRFYPASAEALEQVARKYLEEGKKGPFERCKAVIAPHAGYSYSGGVAGSSFAAWRKDAEVIKRVVLIGPSHWVDFRGIALPVARALSTPLGEVPVDGTAAGEILRMPGVITYHAAHTPEHCLEVELPFLQVMLRDFTIVPLVVGRETDDRVQSVVEALWGGDETRFVISSDLSHYLDYESARRFDQGTAGSIVSLAGAELTPRRACGYRPIRGFLEAAKGHGLKAAVVDLRNSGDTAGRRNEVVGYGAFHFGGG